MSRTASAYSAGFNTFAAMWWFSKGAWVMGVVGLVIVAAVLADLRGEAA